MQQILFVDYAAALLDKFIEVAVLARHVHRRMIADGSHIAGDNFKCHTFVRQETRLALEHHRTHTSVSVATGYKQRHRHHLSVGRGCRLAFFVRFFENILETLFTRRNSGQSRCRAFVRNIVKIDSHGRNAERLVGCSKQFLGKECNETRRIHRLSVHSTKQTSIDLERHIKIHSIYHAILKVVEQRGSNYYQ